MRDTPDRLFRSFRTELPIITETVDKLTSFADSFRLRRCLVVAQFFYEWDKSVKPSQPYLFRLKSNALFALAGIYKEFPDPATGKPILRFVILTTAANSVVSPVHPDRMGAILRREHEATWLNPDIVEPEKLRPLLTPYPADEMECYPVG